MDILNLCQQILHDMWERKLRSLLALFGIIWGTASVILLMSLGHGFIAANQSKIMNLADGSLIVTGGASSQAYRGYPTGYPVAFKADQVMKIPTVVPHIQRITPDFSHETSIRSGQDQYSVMIRGVSGDFFALRKVALESGSRLFTNEDIQKSRDVVVLGSALKKKFFGAHPAIGHHISISGSRFLVIGVIQPGDSSSNEFDNMGIIPYTTFKNIWGDWDITFFIVQPDPGYGPLVQSSLRTYLSNQFHFNPNDQVALQIMDTTAFSDFFRWFFMAIQVFLGVCGALTLCVGGVGVANIMFLIVAERTSEIGLRMAVGARDWQIMAQIITEACMIVGVGGLLGFLLAFLTISSLQIASLPAWMGHPDFSWLSVWATLMVLIMLAILSGYFPAKRAAQMDPVTALSK